MTSDTKHTLVSIILPCYNMERFLERCVDSLLGNDYKDVEIILVDDGSTDSTPQMVDYYASHYNCIKAIHRANGGLPTARNTGMAVATGKYMMFVDPDDYVAHDYISSAVRRIEETNSDLVVFGYSTPWFTNPPVWNDYLPVREYSCSTNKEIVERVIPHFIGITSERFEKWMAGDPSWHTQKDAPTVWRWIFSTDFLHRNNILYNPEYKFCEDMPFILECLAKADRCASLSKPTYYYEPLPAGNTVKAVSPERILETKRQVIDARHKIGDLLKQKYGRDFTHIYAGSVVMASLQVANGICQTLPYSVWADFNSNSQLNDALTYISTTYRGGQNEHCLFCC